MHLKRRSEGDEAGAVIILVALSLVVLCMGVSMAVDLGNAAQLHRHGQYAVDNAALSGADLLEQGTDSLTQIVSATEGYMQENWKGLSSSAWDTCPSIPSGFSAPSGSGQNCVTFNGTSTASATAISVQLPPQSVPFTVARLAGIASGTVEAAATAVVEPGTSPCALCVLGPSGLTLSDTGSGTLSVNDTSGHAGIAVDSTGMPAAQITGSGSITAPQIGVVGSDTVTGSGSFHPQPTTGATVVPDPLGSLVPPSPTTTTIPTQSYANVGSGNGGTLPPSTYGSVSLTGSGSVTIPPGNYSSISVTGSGSLTLEPGTYFITGPFNVTGSGGIHESGGALLYFTCSSGTQVSACSSGQSGGSLSLTGSGSVTLSPMTTGTYTNLTVFYDRNDDAGMTITGSGGLSFSGTIYAESAPLDLTGSGSTLASMIVVNSVKLTGSGSIGVSYDATQNVTPPGVPFLCSTAANNC